MADAMCNRLTAGNIILHAVLDYQSIDNCLLLDCQRLVVGLGGLSQNKILQLNQINLHYRLVLTRPLEPMVTQGSITIPSLVRQRVHQLLGMSMEIWSWESFG